MDNESEMRDETLTQRTKKRKLNRECESWDSSSAGSEGEGSETNEFGDFENGEASGRDLDVTSAVYTPQTRRKRGYRFINRLKGKSRDLNKLRLERMAESNGAITADTLSWPCCKRLRCFQNADLAILRTRRAKTLAAPQQERKRILKDMLDDNGKFYFNRKQVCTFFLQNAFGFSKDLQRSVKGTSMAPSTGMIIRVPKVDVSSKQRDIIYSFLADLAELVGDKMPDVEEIHLPFPQKTHVYALLVDTFRSEFGTELRPPSFSYFASVWNERLRHVKIRKVKRFTKCTDCEMNREALVRWSQDVKRCKAILEEQRAHAQIISKERAAYLSRARKPLREPNRICSIVIDGADQSSYGLPHFVHKVKASRGEGLDVKLVGLLEHRPLPFLHLYTLTGQFATGSNHIIETIHRWVNYKARALQLPPVLLLQLDNCTRENKNRYVLSYLECLVAWGVFVEIEVSFLPIGHTHCDIDQKFSCTSAKLKSNNAVTLEDLHDLLRGCYSPRPVVVGIKRVANISSLLDREKSIAKVPNFSHFRFFKFTRSSRKGIGGTGHFGTSCAVKVNCDDDWKSLFNNENNGGFLLKAPDLRKTPPYSLKKLRNKKEVLDRIDSEEVRIGSSAKVENLRCLVEEIYGGGNHSFEWNMKECIEAKGMRGKLRRYHDHDESDIDLTSYIPLVSIDYKLNAYVAVVPEAPTVACPFWIAKIEKLSKNKYGDIAALDIRWYECAKGANVYQSPYTPSFKTEGNRRVPWFGSVLTDAVFCQIDSLTRANKLGAIAVRRIQEIVECKSVRQWKS